MAFQSKAITSFLLLNIILAMANHALAGRAGLTKQKEEDKKQPKWFIEPDGSVIIPGIGRILVPMPGNSYGSSTPVHRAGNGGYRSSYDPRDGGDSGAPHIPGGDDTLVPNPGYEVPVPSAP